MGSGEYGGNGSIHYYATHKRDRNHGRGRPHNYHEVDEYPSAPGENFAVEVMNLNPGDNYVVDEDGVLTVETPIFIDPANPENYTPSVFVRWPDPPGDEEQG